MTQETTNPKAPDFEAYSVIDKRWRVIGAAFHHQKEEGLTVVLDALPIDGRVVLRKPKKKSEDA